MRPRPVLLAALALTLACKETPSTGEKTDETARAADAKTAAPDRKPPSAERPPAQRAEALAREFIIVDGHVDLPYRLLGSRAESGELTEDVSAATETGNFDHPRARAGGLDAPFMSIFIPAKYEASGAPELADELISMVEDLAKKHPDKFMLATSPAHVRSAHAAGKIALPMGMENGSPLQGKLEKVAYFHGRGIRYITLTHSSDNHISDSSFDDKHTHQGLSDFGKEVVAEMNRVGIMVDVSHISDDAFWQVMEIMEITKVPVIASHSSARHFTPGWERNMSDEMIQALAKNGGVIQVNFGSSFIDDEARQERSKHFDAIKKKLAEEGLSFGEPAAKKIYDEYQKNHKAKYATVEQVADHIDHIVKLVGVDHVGFGSDFDGVGDSLPTGLKDVSAYPNLIRVLLERGYDDDEIKKICGENVLRVWAAVEKHAAGR